MTEKRIIDQDTTDEYLDKPLIRYSDGKTPATGKALDERLDPAYRKAHGLGPAPELPEPTEH